MSKEQTHIGYQFLKANAPNYSQAFLEYPNEHHSRTGLVGYVYPSFYRAYPNVLDALKNQWRDTVLAEVSC
jgi:hypothetical protein